MTPSNHRLWPIGDVTEAEARGELARVLASADFPASERNRRFLAYVVDRAFENGSGHLRVTAWDVAVRVYGRPENFNSILDPIVRIEAGKLRRDLETYYLKSGRDNPLRIEIPRGGYDAVFMRHSPDGAEGAVAEAPAATGRLAEDASAELARVVGSRDFPGTARIRVSSRSWWKKNWPVRRRKSRRPILPRKFSGAEPPSIRTRIRCSHRGSPVAPGFGDLLFEIRPGQPATHPHPQGRISSGLRPRLRRVRENSGLFTVFGRAN